MATLKQSDDGFMFRRHCVWNLRDADLRYCASVKIIGSSAELSESVRSVLIHTS